MEPELASLMGDLQRALAGRYRLERHLGRGGMGIVLLAHEQRLDRRVAIKVLPPAKASDPVARDRFLREARTAAQLSHPNIVPIFAVDHVDDFVFFAMAYVDGGTLGARVRDRGALPPAEGARVLREVASALAYAHAHGVVHRDVKPDNILLDALTGRALVSDFGIARVGSGSGTTGPREVVGTAEFMSPEQASGGVVDGRSDLYSLGVVGYYALSGCLPFEGPDGYALLAQHIAEPAPPLSSVAPGVPGGLAAVIDRCLAKQPLARFASGTDFAGAVVRALATSATPPLELRAFLMKSRHLSTTALLYGIVAGLALPLLALALLTASTPGNAIVAAVGMAWLLSLPVALMYSRVRRLRLAGFTQHDLTGAIEAELRRRREELAFLYGAGPSRLERVLRGTVYAAVSGAGAAVWLAVQRAGLLPVGILRLGFGVAAGVALLAAVGARARTEHRTDPKVERRLRFWRGPLGRMLFRIAGLGLGATNQARGGEGEPAEPGSPDRSVGVVGSRFFERAENTT